MFPIHTMPGMPRINQRFLPWHRVYLAKFEEMLNNVMKKETSEDHNIALPYWDWEHDCELPEFLNDFTRKMDVDVTSGPIMGFLRDIRCTILRLEGF